MVQTNGLFILGTDYKKSFLRIMGNSPVWDLKTTPAKLKPFILRQAMTLRVAKIRKSSGRVGELRWIYLDYVGSISIIEQSKTQKRWYKSVIYFNKEGIAKGNPVAVTVYVYFLPAILRDLYDTCGGGNTGSRTV